MFGKIWSHRADGLLERRQNLTKAISEIDDKIEGLVKRIMSSSSDSVITAYERKIDALEAEKRVLEDEATQPLEPAKPFEEVFRTAMEFLSAPWKLWESGDYNQQRLLLKLAIPKPIPFCKENGFSNRNFALPFNILGGLNMQKCKMVGGERFELPTYWV